MIDSGADRLLRIVVLHGVTGGSGDGPAADVRGDPSWEALVRLSVLHRIQGQLSEAISRGALRATDAQAKEAADLHGAAMIHCLRLEDLLLGAVELLGGIGIEHRVLKGAATAHLDHVDPAHRAFADVDVLVRPQDFDAAVGALTQRGYERRYPQPRPGFDRRFTKSVSFVTSDGLELDLHRTLAEGPLGMRIPVDDLWRPGVDFEVGGRELTAFDPSNRFLHACYHASLGSPVPTVLTLLDIARMLRAPALDLEAVREQARRWRGEIVVARALVATREMFGPDETALPLWVDSYEPRRSETRALRTYTDPSMGYAARAAAAVAAIPGWRSKVSFVRALLFPEQRYMRGRHGSRWSRWRIGVSQAARTLRRP